MEVSDRDGYNAITQNLDRIYNSNIDPDDLGPKLVQSEIIHFSLLETVRAQQTRKDKLGILIEGLLRNGKPGVYEQFLECLSADHSVDWLTDLLRARPQHELQLTGSCSPISTARPPDAIHVATCKHDSSDEEYYDTVENQLPQKDERFIKVNCGCGMCDFTGLITNGCPNPLRQFLYLGTLTKHENDILQLKVKADADPITTKYRHVVLKFRTWMKDNVSIEDYRIILSNIPGTIRKDVPMLKDRWKEIKAADHSDCSVILSEYFTWFNCSILKQVLEDAKIITHIHVDPTDILSALQSYTEEVHKYCKRSIFECPPLSNLSSTKGTTYFILKLDGPKVLDYKTITAEEVKSFEATLMVSLNIPEYALKLCTVAEGCVELVYSVPLCIYSVLFPLNEEQWKHLITLGVTEITTKDCNYKKKHVHEYQQGRHIVTEVKDATVPERAIKEMQGLYWTDLLVQTPPEDFICPVTLDLLTDPYLTSCGHHLSKEAIDKLLSENKPCPLCRKKTVTVLNSEAMECNGSVQNEALKMETREDAALKYEALTLENEMLKNEAVKFDSKSESLENKVLMKKYEAWKNEAPECELLKSDTDPFSTEMVRMSNEGHKRSTALESTIKAVRDRALQRRIHLLEVKCPLVNKGCTWTGPLNMLETHLSCMECQYVETKCPYSCGEKIRCGLLEKHKASCPKRPFTCPYCNSAQSSHDDITTNHMPNCASNVIECPANCGERNLKRQSLTEHRSHCPNEVTNCDFVHAGCNIKVMRKLLKSHNASSTVHHYKLLVTYWNTTINKIRKIQAEDRQIGSMQKLRICNNCPELKMEDYLRHEKNCNPWYSDPFYTHFRGYKLCITFDASKPIGLRSAVQLMKGEFDSDLEFPFCGEIVVQLVDQNIEDKQKPKINTMSACAVFKFDENTQNCNALLTHRTFEDEKIYMKNNRLIFRVARVVMKCTPSPMYCRNVAHAQLQEHIEHSSHKVAECSYCYMINEYDPILVPNACKTIEKTLGPLSIQVHEIIEGLELQRHVLDKAYSTCAAKPAVYMYHDLPEFTMRKFQHYYKNRQVFRSKPFYTHFGGYKMHLRVDGYGCGKELGRHLCVAVVLMKGAFDDRLDFPFRGEITVQLFKQKTQLDCFQSRFEFTSSDVPSKVGSKVSHNEHEDCYAIDNGLENDRFVPLEEVKNCDHLLFKVAKVVVNTCSASCDTTDQRLAIQQLYIVEKGSYYTDVFNKEMKRARKCLKEDKQTLVKKLTKKLKQPKYLELIVSLLLLLYIADAVKSISPPCAETLLLIVSILLVFLITCLSVIQVV